MPQQMQILIAQSGFHMLLMTGPDVLKLRADMLLAFF